MKINRILFLLIIQIVFCCSLSGCGRESEEFDLVSEGEIDIDSEPSLDDSFTDNQNIFVYICGQVKKPGVYELSAGSRVYEAVNAAGGLAEDASAVAINQAELLYDGQQLYVPSVFDDVEVQNKATKADDGGLININTATVEELMSISGIGQTKALGIVEYRETNGRFTSADEITNVSGIGQSTYEKIKDKITVK